MDKIELARHIYNSISWERLYKLAPEATREEVDNLFRYCRKMLENQPPENNNNQTIDDMPGRVTIYTDGAAKGNPGPAGIGVVIYAGDGEKIKEWGRAIGHATNNVAEYLALIEALQQTHDMGVEEITVMADSQLMVRQLTGEYRVKSNKLKHLYKKASHMLADFSKAEIRHIPRDQNAEADKLAQEFANKNGKQ
jgi:ribonuclease HI